jgi:hypothetical protein
MGMLSYGNVSLSEARPVFRQRRRHIALLDVLGTRKWVEKVGAESVASEVAAAVIDVSRQAAEGFVRSDEGIDSRFGPLIGTYFFSDTILAYCVDDSWAALALLCSFLRQLVGVALRRGIPLRGAVSTGEMIVNRSEGLLIGTPLADAYQFDCAHSYRGVGVRVTDHCIKTLRSKIDVDPIPSHLQSSFTAELLSGAERESEVLFWHNASLFIQQWTAEFTAGNPEPSEAVEKFRLKFGLRGLTEDAGVQRKRDDTEAFLRDLLANKSRGWLLRVPVEESIIGRTKDLLAQNERGLGDIDPREPSSSSTPSVGAKP